MLIRSQITTLLQIFCELLLYSQVIYKSMKVADDISKSKSECEWVKEGLVCVCLLLKYHVCRRKVNQISTCKSIRKVLMINAIIYDLF